MNDSIKTSKPVQMALEVTYEVMKLIKFLSRCEKVFHTLKDSRDFDTGTHSPVNHVL